MSILIPLGAILAFVVGALVWKMRDSAAAKQVGRDETLRTGHVTDVDGDAAARRAEGTTAWVRMSDSI